MLNNFTGMKQAYIILIMIFLTIAGCETEPTIAEKFSNNSTNELIYILKNGNVEERRASASLLHNKLHTDLIPDLKESFTSDTDDIVAGYCAMALAKIGDKEPAQILFESALSFSGKRAKTAAQALASIEISPEIVEKVLSILDKKPELLNIFVESYNSSDNESIRELWLEVIAESNRFPPKAVAEVLNILGSMREKRALPAIYRIYFQSSESLLSSAAMRVISDFPDKSKTYGNSDNDPIMQNCEDKRSSELKSQEIVRIRRRARLNPPKPLDEMKRKAASQNLLTIANLELIKDYAPAGHPGGFNNKANSGELLDYKINLRNLTNIEYRKLSGYCYSFSPYVTVLNHKLSFPGLPENEDVQSENSLLILVSPDAEHNVEIELFFEFGESRQGERTVIYVLHKIILEPLPIGPLRFTISDFDDDEWGGSEGNGNGLIEWGEKAEVEISIFNDGLKKIDKATLQLTTDNKLASILNNQKKVENILPKGKNLVKTNFTIQLETGYQGDYEIELLIQISVIEKKRIVGIWNQKVILPVGGRAPQFLGEVYSFIPFDNELFIDCFVIYEEDKNTQERLLFDIEVDYKNSMSLLLIDE